MDTKYNIKFIDDDKYLNYELSKGPKEKPGSINYNYQKYDNVYNYFRILFKESKQFLKLCIPNVIVKYDGHVVRSATAFDIHKNKVYLPKNIVNSVKQCSKNKNYRFIYFSLIIIYDPSEELTHANIIIVDLIKKTIERFEPYGHTIPYDRNKKTKNTIDKMMINVVLPTFNLNNFEYLSSVSLSPYIGIQRIADAYNGFCITISMMYLHMRILNPDVEQKKLVYHFTSMTKSKLKNTILRYAKYVEKKLKKHAKFVNLLNDKLHNQK
jgi:hypothetical protein